MSEGGKGGSNDHPLNAEEKSTARKELAKIAGTSEGSVQNQRARQTGRQLTKTELVQMALAVEKQVAVEAKENSLANLKQNADGSNLNGREDVGRSASKAAESIGVSENTYRDMKLVVEKGSDEQIERMNKGG